jgi:5-methylcytosine-specific restriction enzyme subunit McrC
MAGMTRTIALTEYETRHLPAATITEAQGRRLWERFGAQIDVAFPSPRNGRQWALTSRGWIGFVALDRQLQLELQPRVPLRRWLSWMALSEDFDRWRLPPGVIQAETLPGFYDRLVAWLANRVINRSRQGIYRTYRPDAASLPYVRGRLDVAAALTTASPLALPCRFQTQSADVADNQIVRWTLEQVARSGHAAPETLRRVRRAVRALSGISASRWTAAEVAGRVRDGRAYGRLNADYRPLHGLCALLLARAAPQIGEGDTPAAPFLIDGGALFERAVARWLQQTHRPVRDQETVTLSPDLRFIIDLVLYDRHGDALCVMDTKYKTPSAAPGAADVAQVVAYAEARGCRRAALIYPLPLSRPFQTRVGDIAVAALTFDMGRTPDDAGADFLQQLGQLLDQPGAALHRKRGRAT